MTLAVSALAGAALAWLTWAALRPPLHQPVFLRPNFRGQVIPTAAGLVVPLALVGAEAVRAMATALGWDDGADHASARASVVVAATGLGLLGLVDDLADTGDARGFRGHLAALVRGRLTTGGLKLAGAAAVALVAVAPHVGGDEARLVADAALVALGANLGNLFDRRPGRVVKVSLASFVALAVATGAPGELAPVAVVVGAAGGLLLEDVRERLMLGDAGANVLGGVLALGVVLACSPATRLVTLAVVAVLNGLSEVVSFSRVIDGVAPLRAVDRWGRRRP
ncbi:MAG TPA: hypothetical protein VHE80_11340 [Acidimicrobiales bacterium]|nr:hypothetical protein [Acidimicrobiales bacterium]